MIRNITFFSGGDIIRGFVHYPCPVQNSSGSGVLIIPGFADTAVGPHNMHIFMARRLAAQGFTVLRFDYRGQGDSDGVFEAFTVRYGLDDAAAALNFLSKLEGVNGKRLGVIGYRYALELSKNNLAVKSLGLLAPVTNVESVFRSFFKEHHVRQGETQGWMDWLGWRVGKNFLACLNQVDPLTGIEDVRANMIVHYGLDDQEVPVTNSEALAQYGAVLYGFPGGDHQFSSATWVGYILDSISEYF